MLRNDARGGPRGGSVTMLEDDGTPRWDVTPGFHPVSAADLDGDQLLVWGHADYDGGGAVVLLDAASGATRWSSSLDRPVQAPPLRAGDTLIALTSDFGIDCS